MKAGVEFPDKDNGKVVSTSPPATDNGMAVNILFIFLNCLRGRALSPLCSAASQAPSLSSLTFILTHWRNCPPPSLCRWRLPRYPTVSATVIKDRLQWGSDYFSPIPQGMFASIYSGESGSEMINLDHFKLKGNFRGSKSGAATWKQAHGIKKPGLREVKYFLRLRAYNNLGSNRIGQELLYS